MRVRIGHGRVNHETSAHEISAPLESLGKQKSSDIKMEELQKLERTQSMMMLLESQHLFSPNISNDSHLFLSKFHLFLMEPCGNLSVDDKCSLISQHLPKITASLVEKALVGLPGKSEGFVRDYMTGGQVKEDIGGDVHDLRGQSSLDDDMALIGLESMQRANSTLEDFCRSYFMFHGMEVTRPECLFKYLPVLSFTESYIYQLDSLNEKMVDQIRSKIIAEEQRSCEEARKFMKAFESQPFQSLLRLLQHHELLTPRINEELRQGEEYWALERKLCTTSEQISIEDVMRAIHLKSFDYRVLNLLLYQLRGEEVNDLHMEFLTVSEFLVEISDDLFDYEEDVLENNFNILRMLLRIYEPSAAPTMLAKYITEAEKKYEDLAKDLDPELYLSYQRRCEEATKEGGKIAGHPLGSWTIPPLILDEDLYRLPCKFDQDHFIPTDTQGEVMF